MALWLTRKAAYIVSLLFRYLTRETLASIGIVLIMLTLLFGFFDLLSELDDVRGEGYTLSLALLYVSLGFPGRIHEALPIAALVGALLALARLAMSSEFTVMRTSGLSTPKLAGWAITLGIFLGLATLLIGEYAAPPAEKLAKQIKIRSTSQVVAQEFKSGLWAKDGKVFINIREVAPDASLRGIRLYEFDDQFNLNTVLSAKNGLWQKDGKWQLTEVTLSNISDQGIKTQEEGEHLWQSVITPDLLTALMVNPERMALSTLYSYVQHLHENQQNATQYEIALWSKLAFPLAAPIMLLLALPFAFHQGRNRGISGQVLLGILIGLSFHLFNRLSGHIGLLNAWPPVLSALLPLCAFSFAALIALWRADRH